MKHEIRYFYTFLQRRTNAIIDGVLWQILTLLQSQAKLQLQEELLQLQEQLFLTLTRLSCVLPIECISVRFNISISTVSRTYLTCINFLHSKLFKFANLCQSFQNTLSLDKVHFRLHWDIYMLTSFRSHSVTFSICKH